jgi:hypothetical protein
LLTDEQIHRLGLDQQDKIGTAVLAVDPTIDAAAGRCSGIASA